MASVITREHALTTTLTTLLAIYCRQYNAFKCSQQAGRDACPRDGYIVISSHSLTTTEQLSLTVKDIALAAVQGQGAPRKGRAEDRIYDSIRHAVLTQKLPPGSRLPELTLSEIFGVSRSVVRRALVRLAGDHIILMRRNQIAVVAKPGPEETAQIFEARRHVEGEVMRQVAGSLDEAARREIAELVDAEHAAHEQGAHEDRIHLSLRFHERLADLCPNQVLGRILQELILRTSITVALYKVPGMSACYRAEDHRGITDAVLAGDGERAARIACEHLDHLEERLTLAERAQQVDLASILGG